MNSVNLGQFDLKQEEGVRGALHLMDQKISQVSAKIDGQSSSLDSISEGVKKQQSSIVSLLIGLIVAIFAFFCTVGGVLYFFIQTDHSLSLRINNQESKTEWLIKKVDRLEDKR